MFVFQDEEKKDEGQEKDKKPASTAPSSTTTTPSTSSLEESKKEEDKKEEEKKEEEKKEPEPTFEFLTNPARAMKSQLRVLSPKEGSKYRPVKEVSTVKPLMDSPPNKTHPVFLPIILAWMPLTLHLISEYLFLTV